MVPFLLTWSPLMVTQFRLDECAAFPATSRSLHTSTLPNTCRAAQA
jgi:hypothetical protein